MANQVKLLLTQYDYDRLIDKARAHPLWNNYKVKGEGFKPRTNAFKEVLIEAYFSTKSQSDQKNVDIFENLFNSFEGCSQPAFVTCGKVSFEV